MKFNLILFFSCKVFLIFSTNQLFAQVGIGTLNPDASAKLEVNSTTQGFLPPRMTTAQRDAIGSPATGLVIFNTSTNGIEIRTSSGWVKLVLPTDNAANVTGTVAVANGGTGATTSTGSGSVVLSNSPFLTTPSLGVASATSINTAGLKFTNLNSSTPVSSGATLGVDASGNVVTVVGSSFTATFGSSRPNGSIIIPPLYEQDLATITLPTTGTYLINYTMRVQSSGMINLDKWAVGYLSYTTSPGTPIVGTEILGAYSNSGAISGGNYSGSFIITTTTTNKIIYFIGRAFGDEMQFLDDENGRTTITYIKISP